MYTNCVNYDTPHCAQCFENHMFHWLYFITNKYVWRLTLKKSYCCVNYEMLPKSSCYLNCVCEQVQFKQTPLVMVTFCEPVCHMDVFVVKCASYAILQWTIWENKVPTSNFVLNSETATETNKMWCKLLIML